MTKLVRHKRVDASPYLFNRVLQADRAVRAKDERGRWHRLEGVGAKYLVLNSAPVRYVLDETTSARCLARVRGDRQIFDTGSPTLRLPETTFWLEWSDDTVDEKFDVRAFGVLVEADDGGRGGLLTCYYQRADGRADLIVLTIRFDFDCPLWVVRATRGRIALRHADYSHLDELFNHAVGELLPGWQEYIAAMSPVNRAASLRELAEFAWMHLPVLAAFCHLLNSRQIYCPRTDASRTVVGAPIEARVDRIESVLHLERQVDGSGGPNAGASRSPARCHQVRGHYVTRGSSVFWRSPHRRGTGEKPPLSKTVHVEL